jgi:hypothetical protein
MKAVSIIGVELAKQVRGQVTPILLAGSPAVTGCPMGSAIHGVVPDGNYGSHSASDVIAGVAPQFEKRAVHCICETRPIF